MKFKVILSLLVSFLLVSVVSASERSMYIIKLKKESLVHYKGDVAGLRTTSPAALGVRKLDAKSADSIAYLSFLENDLTQVKSSISSLFQRDLGKTHDYFYASYGFALELTQDEAILLANQSYVLSVEKDKQYELNTDAGPKFIGANTLWDGTNMPDSSLNQGEGVIVGIIDTGINMTHPSFSDLPEDGYDFAAANPLGAGNFVAGSACSATFVCNDKLIGAWDFADDGTETDGPEDSNGHGSHVASTAAGNAITAPPGGFVSVTGAVLNAPEISGVAPHAHIISYDVCVNSCSGFAISSAINQAIADGVDVISFSISGGLSPWSSSNSDRIYLDAVAAGIMVSTSAGNTSASTPTTFGNVNHRGPWLLSVAMSTHNRANSNAVTITDPAPVPTSLVDMYGLLGSVDNFTGDVDAGLLYAGNVEPGNEEGCTAFADNTAFTAKIALIIRGSCNFSVKIDNAAAAGAVAAIIYNGVSDLPIVMGAIDSTTIPAVMIGLADGDAIVSFISTVVATDVNAFISGTAIYSLIDSLGNILSDGSLIGPNNSFNVTKPDINGPGIAIFAAVASASGPSPQFDFLTGTSMSAPHVSGSSALLIAAQPEWSPSQIKAAIMMTADTSGLRGSGDPVNADDVGSGTIDLRKAAKVGLTMDETFANYLAADPAAGGTPETLNIPSARNSVCGASCSWTRTLTSQLPVNTSWTVAAVTDGTFSLSVSPMSFDVIVEAVDNPDVIFKNSFGDDIIIPIVTQNISFTATGVPTTAAEMSYGEIILTEVNGLSPDLRITVAVNQVLPSN